MPPDERGNFQYDWQQKLFHRWQFLREAGLWSAAESAKLLWSGLAAIPDAVQHFGAQESVRTRVSRFIQSPLSCLGGLAFLLLLATLFSGGFPATRDVFFKRVDSGPSRLVYVWSHNLRGGGDRPLPAEVVEAWRKHSQLISGAAAFRAVHRDVGISGKSAERRLVVITEPSFFPLMETQLTTGAPVDSVLLSYGAWLQEFHASPRLKGTSISIGGQLYPIVGILPAGFRPLSREAAFYLVEPKYAEKDAFAAVRVNPGVSAKTLDREFTSVAQDVTYYFLNGQLRYGFAQSEAWTPVRSFGFGLLAAVLMLVVVFRMKWRMVWTDAQHREASLRRIGFFCAKTTLALAFAFAVCLEWSRSTSAILFGNFDPASGPFLLWLYILVSMGVLFWAVVDQKARCRQCLQLLAFPVRMGSPGSLLLDWSGIELCCTEGHGVLHVPHLAPSWADESEHWIEMDDSWQSVFGRDKKV